MRSESQACDPTTAHVAGEVRASLARRRLSGNAAADAANITRSSMYRRLNGEQPFSVDELSRIANLVGVDVRSFFPSEPVAS